MLSSSKSGRGSVGFRSRGIRRGRWVAVAAAVLLSCYIQAQGTAKHTDITETTTPRSWVEAACLHEEQIIDDDGSFPIRYKIRKVDTKNDVTRDVIESRQGTVARLILRNGKPITEKEDALERERLTGLLESPKDFAKHHKRDMAARSYSLELVRQLPHAMVATFAPGQPQLPYLSEAQVVIDIAPDPAYKPPSMVTQALTGVQGRAWIDKKSQRLVRLEASVVRTIDAGWGMLARIYPGGTVEFEQANPGGDRWAYSKVRSNLTIREMMVKTVQQHTTVDAADFQLLSTPIDYQEAVKMLLATPLKLAPPTEK